MRYIFFLFLLMYSLGIHAQKRAITHADYDGWKSITNTQLASNGHWVVYEQNPQDGDGNLILYPLKGNRLDSIPRGKDAQFSFDNQYLVSLVAPVKDSILLAKKAKKKADELPKDGLAIYSLNQNTISFIPAVLSFKLPEKQGVFVVYHAAPAVKSDKKKGKKESKENGSKLIVRNLETEKETSFEFITNYILPKEGKKVAFISTGNDSTFLAGVYLYDFSSKELSSIYQQKKAKFSQLSFSEDGSQLAFIADLDTSTTTLRRNPNLFYWKKGDLKAILVADSVQNPAPKGWLVSDNFTPTFSKDGSKLYFGTIERPLVKDTTVLEEDIVKVDVWNYKDAPLMTQQLANLKSDLKKSYLAVLSTSNLKTVQLATKEIPTTELVEDGNADFVVASSNLPYSHQHWDWNGTNDIYAISAKDGQAKKIATSQKISGGGAKASPKGKYIYWYSKADTAWFAYQVKSEKLIRLTQSKDYSDVADDDHPDLPNPYGLAGWTNDDESILIYDKYDIWKINPDKPSDATCLTDGRKTKTTFRYIKLEEEEKTINLEKPIILHLFDEQTKQSGYASLQTSSKSNLILLKEAARFSQKIWKAKNTTDIVFTKETFHQFPDLFVTDNLSFSGYRQLSNANPQQQQLLWGSVEMVSWKSLDGVQLNGLLYKPEGFDPSKKYPMITYYYEKNSDNLHEYTVPEPERASVNYAYYTSNGYLVFVPDIVYKIGYPGQSAYNCIMPGVMSLLDKGFVDEKRLGLQGHSWGGYQTAYLVTQTNLFRAAEAGAPVANMTSAYGGIRWDTGLSRMAQYERTQSRIGATLWEKPMQYIENSPLFYVPKIETPLLILHNDDDGAVPWYQGIEFFLALKRFNKPAWMLNYNGEKHGLTLRKNKKDWTIRMAQFFDYYLKDAPMPLWMKEGIPATEKTLNYGLGY